MDQYAGVYSYQPKTSYCVKDDIGYISFEWNKRSAGMSGGWNPSQDLLMTVMPHQVSTIVGYILFRVPVFTALYGINSK